MVRIVCMLLAVLGLSACGTGEISPETELPLTQSESMEPETPAADPGTETPEEPETVQENPVLKITVGEYELQATLEDNPSAEEFRELLTQGPVTIDMEDYGGFEKVGPLGTTLTRTDTQITTEPGDVILYQGNQITIYYGTNSWNFTQLAKIDDPTGLQEKLGEGAVQVTFSLE